MDESRRFDDRESPGRGVWRRRGHGDEIDGEVGQVRRLVERYEEEPTVEETETIERTFEEGEIGGQTRVFHMEKVTFRKSVRQIEFTREDSGLSFPSESTFQRTPESPPSTSWSREDSAFKSQTYSSSPSNVSPSLASPISHGADDSGGSWRFRTGHHPFHATSASKVGIVRSISQYDSHIKQIRGETPTLLLILLQTIC